MRIFKTKSFPALLSAGGKRNNIKMAQQHPEVKNYIAWWKKTGLIEKLLYLFIIFLPVMKVPRLPVFEEKIQYSDVIFILLFLLWFRAFLKKQRKIQKVMLGFPLFLLLISFSLSFINSERRIESGVEFLGILYLACLYFLLNQLIDSEEIWFNIVSIWTKISLVISAIGIFAYLLLLSGVKNEFLLAKYDLLGYASQNLVYRVTAFFRHPGMFAAYLHAGIVFAFALAFHTKTTKIKWWICLAIIFCTIAALLTKTRVNLGISLTIFIIVNHLFRERNFALSVVKYISFLYFVCLLIFFFFTTIWWVFPINIYFDKDSNILKAEFNFTHQSYFIQHKAAIDMLMAHPLIGVGMGMYNYKSAEFVKWEEAGEPYRMMFPQITEKSEDLYKRGYDPHSTYLGWAAETGLLGLIGIIIFFYSILKHLFLHFKNNRDTKAEVIYICFLAGIGSFLLNGTFIDILTMRHFWVLVAMALTITKFDNTEPASSRRRHENN